jgi:hypothetical protein
MLEKQETTNNQHRLDPKCAKSRSDDQIQGGTGKSQVKNRKYEDDYMKFEFTWSGDQECPKPWGVICGDVLANSSLRPPLRSHLETHSNKKNVDVFKRKLAESKGGIANIVSTTSNDNEMH